MASKKRVAIIGCGRIAGWNELDPYREKPCTHIGGYQTRKDVEVIGCCDVQLKQAKKFAKQFGISFFTDSIRDLLKQQTDIVSICIPYKLNLETIRAVAGSKHRPKKIFLEKPIAHSLGDAKKIVNVCQRNGVKLYVNNRRVSPFYQRMRKILDQEFNGELLSISAWCSSGMHTIGIHMVDLLRSLCGDVKTIYATREQQKIKKLPYSTNFTADDPRFNVFLSFENGVDGVLFNSARSDYTFFEVEAICKTGRVRASDNGNRLIIQKKIAPKGSTLSYKLGTEREIKYSKEPLFKLLIDEVLDGRYKSSPINAQQALASYQVIDAMQKSAQTRKVQTIK